MVGRGTYSVCSTVTVGTAGTTDVLDLDLGPMLRGVYPSPIGPLAALVVLPKHGPPHLRRAKRMARMAALEEYARRTGG